MNHLLFWAGQRPVISTLLLLLLVSMCAMLFLWRKDAEYFTSLSGDCPDEYVVKRRLFHGAKFLAIGISIGSIFIEF
jgi:hypothetical protein